MPKFDAIQTSFLGGEFSPRAFGRLDLELYRSGASEISNFIVRQHGGLSRRGGSKFVAAAKYGAKETILQDYSYKDSSNFMLEFGEYYVRFYKDQAQLQVAYAAWLTTTVYVLGDLVTEAGQWYRCIIAHTAGVFATDLANLKWEVSGGATDLAYEIPTSFTEAQVSNLRFAADEKTLYITHEAHLPQRLDYTSDTSWALSAVSYISFSLTPAAAGTGYAVGEIITVTQAGSSGGTLEVESVDTSGGITGLKILTQGTAYTIEDDLATTSSGAGVNALIDCISETHPGAWGTANYPRLVWFYEQRLMFASTPNEPNGIWGSHSADYFNFTLGSGLDSEAIYIRVKQANVFVWVVATDVLLMGASNGEFLIVASQLDDALTPSNIRPVRATGHGGADNLVASRIDSSAVFVQRGLRKIRRLQYDSASTKYIARNISVLSEHITESGVADVAYLDEPDSIMWFMLTDGNLAALTYDPDNNVFAWHSHTIAGVNALVKSIASTKGKTADQDELWLVVTRTVNSATVRHIEFKTQGLPTDSDIEDSFFVDSGVTATGSDLAEVTTLSHLEGEEVQILADGAVQSPQTVSSGTITISPVADVVHAGLGFTSYVDTMPLEGGNPAGTSQGKMKQIHRVTFRLNRSLGLEFGVPGDTLDRYYFGPGVMDEGAPLFTGDTEDAPFPGGPSTQGLIRVQQSDPLPLNILAIMVEAETEL